MLREKWDVHFRTLHYSKCKVKMSTISKRVYHTINLLPEYVRNRPGFLREVKFELLTIHRLETRPARPIKLDSYIHFTHISIRKPHHCHAEGTLYHFHTHTGKRNFRPTMNYFYLKKKTQKGTTSHHIYTNKITSHTEQTTKRSSSSTSVWANMEDKTPNCRIQYLAFNLLRSQ